MEKKSPLSTVVWSDEDQAFIATSTNWPHVSAHGDTKEEALKELSTALEMVYDLLDEDQKA